MPNNPRAASLDAILAVTRARVAALKTRAAELERGASTGAAPAPFPTPGAGVGVIAEVTRRSPPHAAMRGDPDPVVHAAAFVRGGVNDRVEILSNRALRRGAIREDLDPVVHATA